MNALRWCLFGVMTALTACGPSTAMTTELDDELTAVDEAELRALATSELVGDLESGQTLATTHPGGAKYRAYRFVAPAGPVDLWVRSADGDAKAWLLGEAFQTLARNDDASTGVSDSHLARTLTRAGTYYVAFREAQGERATFSVSLNARTVDAGTPVVPVPLVLPALSYQRRIFITRTAYDGDLRTAGGGVDGLEGADRLCAIAAISTNLGGTWKAWLSTSSVRAIDRIAEGGPWVNLAGSTVFANKTGMAVGPLNGITYNERHESSGETPVWSGTARLLGLATTPDSAHTAATCRDWTSGSYGDRAGFGLSSATTGSWTQWDALSDSYVSGLDEGLLHCQTRARLICIEQ